MGSHICISEREKLCTSPRKQYKKTTKIPREYYEKNTFGLINKTNYNVRENQNKKLNLYKKN